MSTQRNKTAERLLKTDNESETIIPDKEKVKQYPSLLAFNSGKGRQLLGLKAFKITIRQLYKIYPRRPSC